MPGALMNHEIWIHTGILVRIVVLVLIVAVFQLWVILLQLEAKFDRLKRLEWHQPRAPQVEGAASQEPTGVVGFSGRRTYWAAVLLFAVTVLRVVGLVPPEVYQALAGLLMSLGMAWLQAGIMRNQP